jgi:hypothetical protein
MGRLQSKFTWPVWCKNLPLNLHNLFSRPLHKDSYSPETVPAKTGHSKFQNTEA